MCLKERKYDLSNADEGRRLEMMSSHAIFLGSLLGIFVQQLERRKVAFLIGVGSKSFEYCCATVRRTNVAYCNVLFFKSALLLLLME